MSIVFKCLAAVTIALPLAACGQTGSLYLPDESQQVIVRERDARALPPTSDAPAQKSAEPQTDPRGL